MRQLNTHTLAGDHALQIVAIDQPAPGYPRTRYDIMGFNTVYNAAANDPNGPPAHFTRLALIFENGPRRPDMPLNGITEEALLSVVADHLDSKQRTPEACAEFQQAQICIMQAIKLLTQRDTMNMAMPVAMQYQPQHQMMPAYDHAF